MQSIISKWTKSFGRSFFRVFSIYGRSLPPIYNQSGSEPGHVDFRSSIRHCCSNAEKIAERRFDAVLSQFQTRRRNRNVRDQIERRTLCLFGARVFICCFQDDAVCDRRALRSNNSPRSPRPKGNIFVIGDDFKSISASGKPRDQ